MAEENGVLEDDVQGVFQYFTPANTTIIPHGAGYYAEFTVNSFSEFWFNNGGANISQPQPIILFSFLAAKQSGKAVLNWKIQNEINAAKFIIERSADGINFIRIDSLSASDTSQYNFIDVQPLPGINYYRLKLIERNGAYTYSTKRKLNFSNNADDILIYPNPVTSETIFISASANCSSAILYDASGKLIKNFVLQGTENTIKIKGILKGIYLMKIISANSTHTEKIMVQ